MIAAILSINDYSTMPDLPYVLHDTTQIKDTLLKTKWDIVEWEKDIKADLVYVSSHGTPNGIILPNGDIEPLKSFVAPSRLTVFSACYTGQAIESVSLSGHFVFLGEGLVISASTQAAYEIPEIKGSILTESVCEEISYWKNQDWFTIDGVSTIFLQNVLNKCKSYIRKYTGGWQSSPVVGRLKTNA